MKLTGAEIIIRLLERQGIRIIAGIPGGANLPIYDALSRSRLIRHVLTRHEQGAGFIAQGMSRVSGRPEVCLATSGPGATNLLTAIADAKLDSVPIICITGQVPTDMIGTDAFQEVDTYGLSISITKHNFLVRSGKDLLRIIPEAFRIAVSGRPGPVLIDVPKDIQMGLVEFNDWLEPGKSDPFPCFDISALKRAAEMINDSRRPVLYIGGGVVRSQASSQVTRLAEKAGIPVVMTLMGLGVLGAGHALSLGMIGMHAARHTNFTLEECDLLIAVGVRFDDRATGKVSDFCRGAKIIHIDIDPSELHKIKHAHIGIAGDAGEVMDVLLPMVRKNKRKPWLARIACLRAEDRGVGRDEYNFFNPHKLIREVADSVKDDAIIVTDVGQHQMWTAQAFPFQRPGQLLTSGGLGTMGFGVPAAIGAALAEPEKQVVCFSGDGSIMMNIQELATAVEYGVNIKIILMNNNALGLVQQQQDLFYNKRIYASDYNHRLDFVNLARGFGMNAYDLSGNNEPKAMLDHVLCEKGPCLIHVPIDLKERVFPMVPPGAPNREMIECAEYV